MIHFVAVDVLGGYFCGNKNINPSNFPILGLLYLYSIEISIKSQLLRNKLFQIFSP